MAEEGERRKREGERVLPEVGPEVEESLEQQATARTLDCNPRHIENLGQKVIPVPTYARVSRYRDRATRAQRRRVEK